jgi:hypothetical protein
LKIDPMNGPKGRSRLALLWEIEDLLTGVA